MRIMERFAARARDPLGEKLPTIAFLGDSVTDGCFELRRGADGGFSPIYDRACVYHKVLERMLGELYPTVPVHIVNAGLNGTSSVCGRDRLERDVLAFHPDLTVVCFGLNDVHKGREGIATYHDALSDIFRRLRDAGCEVIYMTPNMMDTSVGAEPETELLRKIAFSCMEFQNNGTFDAYIEAGRTAAREQGAAICDVYERWKRLWANGVDVTALLCNRINHPTREMHRLFAHCLLETMLSENETITDQRRI